MDERASWMDAAFATEEGRRKRAAARLKDIRAQKAKINEGIARFGGDVYCADYGAQYLVYWTLHVDDFREAAPLIEYLEAFAGECSSRDWAQFRQRDFTFPLISLSCYLKSEAEACRVVVVGHKAPEPIFAFECAEDRP